MFAETWLINYSHNIDLKNVINSFFNTVNYFPLLQMAFHGKKRELAAINGNIHEEHPNNNQPRDINVPKNQ